MKNIYFLSEYNWEVGELISTGSKNFKVYIPDNGFYSAQTKYIPKEKCAMPDEIVCIVWETWKGKNGRGGYRVERELYPSDRIRADTVGRQPVSDYGRIQEIAFGIKR